MANRNPKVTCPQCGCFMRKSPTPIFEPHYIPENDRWHWYSCDEYVCSKCRTQDTALNLVEDPVTPEYLETFELQLLITSDESVPVHG